MTGPGDELAELLWDHGPALLRRAPAAPPPPFFQPFTCSAAGSSRSQELKRHAADAVNPVPLGMHGAGGLGLGGLPVVHDENDDDDDAVPWLHCPVVDDGDADTAPLPPEYCASLLSDYSEPEVAAPPAAASHAAAVVPAAPPPEAAAAANKLAPPSASAGEGVVNFTFFSRPLQRPQAAATASQPVESTVVQAATTNRLRSTPLFSEQRMAWLQPPKAPRAATAAAAATLAPPPPPPSPPPPPLPAPMLPLPDSRRGEMVAQPPSSQPEGRPPDAAAAVTTSSVCSGNGDRAQLKRSSHLAADCSVSPDEDLDDEPGETRRSAARSAKRSRTAEVHNLSERRRRDRINEKMRALQELIPNCNKIDKASMLEEAIEYLKTLQLQVQMMSMGTGLCMPMPPPAMLLPAMHQHMQALPLHHHHPMAHFPHLGMGLGYGMGMGAAAAAGFDMLPRVAAGAPHFPCPPMAMPPPGAMFGMPGQGMPAAFAHMAGAGIGTAPAPAAQMEAAAAAAAPARPGEAEHRPVVGVAQGDQEAQHPKQT